MVNKQVIISHLGMLFGVIISYWSAKFSFFLHSLKYILQLWFYVGIIVFLNSSPIEVFTTIVGIDPNFLSTSLGHRFINITAIILYYEVIIVLQLVVSWFLLLFKYILTLYFYVNIFSEGFPPINICPTEVLGATILIDRTLPTLHITPV